MLWLRPRPGRVGAGGIDMRGERGGDTVGPDARETHREPLPAGSVFAYRAG